MARYRPFKCINCGAVVSWDKDATEATCDYCGTAVPAQSIAAARRGRSAKGLVIAIIVGSFGMVLVGMLVFGLMFMRACDKGMDATRSVMQAGKALEQAKRAPSYSEAHKRFERERAASRAQRRKLRRMRSATTPSASSEHFKKTLEFGTEGKGPGQLDDPRQITADREGRIYVADYFNLRVQVFDKQGAFLRAIQLEKARQGRSIHGLALDYAGHLYVSRAGELLKIRLDGDKIVKTLRARRLKFSVGDVAVTAAGEIFVQNVGAMTYISTSGPPQKDNLRKLSKGFKLLKRFKGDEASSGTIAVDGVGNVVIAGRYSRRIDMLDSSGKLTGRIPLGRRGYPSSVALDGKGRIFLASSGVQVLDRSGKQLFDLGVHGVRDVNLGQDGQLYVVTARARVLRFKLTE